MSALPVARPAPAVAFSRARPVLLVEAKLARELRAVQSLLTAPLLAALPDRDQPLTAAQAATLLQRLELMAGSRGLTRVVARRVARLVTDLAMRGQADADDEIAGAARRGRFAAEPIPEPLPPRISEADAAYYDQAARALVEKISAEHYDRLRATVTDGLRRGVTDRQLGREIHQLDLGLARHHADTWARTETTRFYTLGRVRSIEAAGEAVWGYEYVVIVDNRTTEICQGYIGKRVAKADMTHFPPFHYNCRTTVRAVMAEAVSGEPEQPEGTELGPEAEPEKGFGDDPRDLLADVQAPTATAALRPANPDAIEHLSARDRRVYAGRVPRLPVPDQIEKLERLGEKGHAGGTPPHQWHPADNQPGKPLPEAAQRYLDGMGYKSTAEQVDVQRAIHRYTSTLDPSDRVLEKLDEFIELAPKFQGRLVRAMELPLDPDGVPDLTAFRGGNATEPDGEFELHRPTSFTSGRAAQGNVHIVVEQNLSGASIRGFAHPNWYWQDEVLVPTGTKYVVRRIERTILPRAVKGSRKSIVLYVEEVRDAR